MEGPKQPSLIPTETSKPWIKWVLMIVVIALLSSLTTFFILTTVTKQETVVQEGLETTTSQPTPTPNKTAGWKVLTLAKMSFKIPPEWVSEEHQDTTTGAKSHIVDPQPLPRPSDAIYAFAIRFVPNSSAKTQKQKIVGSLTVTKDENFKLQALDGILIEGKYSTGPLESQEVRFAIWQFGNDVYYIENLNSNYTTYFDQILSTFTFD